MSYQIKDSVALVTGANRGIGKAIVEGLLDRGAAKVYAAVRKPSSADELVSEYGGRVVPIEFDLEKPESIEAAAKAASDVTLVVNNAGVLRVASPLAEDAVDALKFEMNVNVYGLIRVAQAFAPVLKKNGGGGFVQLNSVASLRSFPDFATYAASKAAAYSITQALKTMLSDDGIQVVSVHPGPIATDMASNAGLDEVAEPPSLVADAIIDALATDKFHAFPDSMAKQIGGAYESFATQVIEGSTAEA
ncbi:SDR family oxidoreductase [Bythopirellula polymerisocia]|uniref:(S)-1-Phenylethanol dehydrogenase n=1 Tax=Bythopirellula polymerisocia TaxID=2528003 RepID=A0A5C6D2J4_9BACT|nr:SDR family oxidoreductase [Bythopirellula polymerisocia]TWU29877.1 (S)-1-Phenylethanol dehydrogenase [Bythopirellula polymerisocia]